MPAEKQLPPAPFNEGMLSVSGKHQLYYAQYGNPKGQAIVLLHGGPGSNSQPKQAASYDLEKMHIILFDQRGCGLSTPKMELSENTTQHIVEDIEKLRLHLGLASWLVAGNSWGSALALLYAQAHPRQVKGLLLTSVFLAEAEKSAAWVYGEEGAAQFFPKEFETCKQKLPVEEQHDIAEGYKKYVISDLPEAERTDWAVAFLNWQGSLCGMEANNIAAAEEQKQYDDLKTEAEKQEALEGFRNFALTHVTLQMHYESNHFFIEAGQIMRDIGKISHIPTLIVHGRYDVMCSVKGAYELHQALPQSQLHIVPSAGHSRSEIQDTFDEASKVFLAKL